MKRFGFCLPWALAACAQAANIAPAAGLEHAAGPAPTRAGRAKPWEPDRTPAGRRTTCSIREATYRLGALAALGYLAARPPRGDRPAAAALVAQLRNSGYRMLPSNNRTIA